MEFIDKDEELLALTEKILNIIPVKKKKFLYNI